jgi:nucleoid DNA-binding protein
VNKSELAEAVGTKTGLDKRQSEAAVSAVTDVIVAEIRSGNRVSIFGFGSFEPKSLAARTARNPQTQAIVKVPAKKGVGFKAAAAFKEALNSKAKKAAPAAKAPAKKAPAAKAPAKKAPAPAKAVKAAKKR